MKIKIFDLFGDIKLNDGNVENKLDKIDKKAKNTGGEFDALGSRASRLGSMLTNAFSFATGQVIFRGIETITNGIKSGIKAGMDYNSSMQQNQIAFEVLTKSGEKATKMMKDLNKMAESTPFELPQLTNAAKTLLAFGFNAEQATNLMKPLGDAASANGERASEALNNIAMTFGQIRSAGKLTTQDLKQLTGWGIGAFEILAKQTGKTTAQIQEMVSDGLIPADKGIEMLTKGINENFGGMMDKQSKSFSGLMSTLKDGVKSTFGEITMPMFEKLSTNVIPKVISAVEEFKTNFKGNGSIIETIAIMVGDRFGETFGDIVIATRDAFDFLKNKANEVLPVVQTIVRNALDVVIIPLFNKLKDIISIAMPIIQSIITNVFNSIRPLVMQLYDAFNTYLLPIILDLMNKVQVALPTVKKAFDAVFPVIKWLLGVAVDGIVNFIRNVKGIYDAISPVLNSVIKIFDKVSSAIRTAVDWLGSWSKKNSQVSPSTQARMNQGYWKGGYATGTDNATRGWHLVGEEGAELMYFNGGEKVINHEDTNKALGGINVNIQTFVNNRKQDVQAFAEELEFYRRQSTFATGGAY